MFLKVLIFVLAFFTFSVLARRKNCVDPIVCNVGLKDTVGEKCSSYLYAFESQIYKYHELLDSNNSSYWCHVNIKNFLDNRIPILKRDVDNQVKILGIEHLKDIISLIRVLHEERDNLLNEKGGIIPIKKIVSLVREGKIDEAIKEYSLFGNKCLINLIPGIYDNNNKNAKVSMQFIENLPENKDKTIALRILYDIATGENYNSQFLHAGRALFAIRISKYIADLNPHVPPSEYPVIIYNKLINESLNIEHSNLTSDRVIMNTTINLDSFFWRLIPIENSKSVLIRHEHNDEYLMAETEYDYNNNITNRKVSIWKDNDYNDPPKECHWNFEFIEKENFHIKSNINCEYLSTSMLDDNQSGVFLVPATEKNNFNTKWNVKNPYFEMED